jgi:hypothetical protein
MLMKINPVHFGRGGAGGRRRESRGSKVWWSRRSIQLPEETAASQVKKEEEGRAKDMPRKPIDSMFK